jgi:hypothetical protein
MLHRPTAPADVLILRVTGATALVLAYGFFRAPLLSTWSEVGVALVIGATAVMVGIDAAAQLVDRRTWLPVDEAPRTEQFTVPMRWPSEIETAIAAARHTAMMPLIDRGEVTEPRLFTHEYNPITPPRGFPAVHDLTDTLVPGYPNQMLDDPEVLVRIVREQLADVPSTGRHRADHEAPQQSGGRHALADAQLNRERAHGAFGVW